MKNLLKNPPAFTLIEALVALTIMTVALIPAFQQATAAIALSGTIRNSLTATNLAQEGVEVIRAIRDANWFASQPFGTGLTPDCVSGCLVQSDSAIPLPLNGNPDLKLDPNTGLYQYGSGADTGFSRKITVEQVSADELKVISEVAWKEKSGTKTFAVEYHLFDWLK